MPVNPNRAATRATSKKAKAQFNMIVLLSSGHPVFHCKAYARDARTLPVSRSRSGCLIMDCEWSPFIEREEFKMRTNLKTLIRHEGEVPRERSTCGWRDRLISREDSEVAAWAHAVDIDGAKLHYQKRSTELYYVLDGGGSVLLDGVAHDSST
jgi:hypothetical protein